VRADRLLAALLVFASTGVAAAVDLGTLFTTPDERARLDRLRRGEPVLESRGSTGQRQPLRPVWIVHFTPFHSRP